MNIRSLSPFCSPPAPCWSVSGWRSSAISSSSAVSRNSASSGSLAVFIFFIFFYFLKLLTLKPNITEQNRWLLLGLTLLECWRYAILFMSGLVGCWCSALCKKDWKLGEFTQKFQGFFCSMDFGTLLELFVPSCGSPTVDFPTSVWIFYIPNFHPNIIKWVFFLNPSHHYSAEKETNCSTIWLFLKTFWPILEFVSQRFTTILLLMGASRAWRRILNPRQELQKSCKSSEPPQ